MKIVPIQVEPSESKPLHPALKFAGVFKDDADFEAVQKHVQEYRDELDTLSMRDGKLV